MASRATKTPPDHALLAGVTFKALPVDLSSYRRPVATASDVIERVRGEFVEMRGFSPTVDQAVRLFQINREECGRILTGLVEEGFLNQTPDGRYRLRSQR